MSKCYLAPLSWKMGQVAKSSGARWDPEQGRWRAPGPIAWAKLTHLLEDRAARCPWPARDWQDYTYEQRQEAKEAGCRFDAEAKCWYMPN